MKKKIKLIYIILLFVSVLQIKGTPNKYYVSEEVSIKETSSVFLVKQDSLIKQKIDSLSSLYKKENYVDALKNALVLFELAKRQKASKESLFEIQFLIASIYDKTNNYNRALDTFKRALFILEKDDFEKETKYVPYSINISKTYLRIGTLFQKISKKDSAIFYLSKLESFPEVNKEILRYKAISYANLVGVYQVDSLYDKAMSYAEKSIKINKIINDKINESIVTGNLGSIYLSLNKFDLSKEYYLKAINLIKNNNSQNAVRLKADIYYNLAWAMRNLKEYKAYDYQELSYEIEDGIRDKEIRAMVEKVTAKYNVEAARKVEENKRLKERTTFWIYAIGSIIVILSLLYWVYFYKLNQKHLDLKLSQTKLLQNQNIEKLKLNLQNRLLNATIDGKESERKEIAETLHDSVSALLSSANLHLMATKKHFNEQPPVEIEKAQKIIKEASEKIRDLSHNLVSSVLLKFGLEYAIKDMAAKYSNSTLNLEPDIQNIRRYHQTFEIKVYNIIQEIINNVIKHSKASNSVIKILEVNHKIFLQISDDGIGFDKTKIGNKDGLGINQIDARIQVLKGGFQINSKKGEGTIVKIELPIVEKDTTNLV